MHSLRVLEYESIRRRLQATCETTMGHGLAEVLTPTFELDAVWSGLEATSEAYDALSKHAVPGLGGAKDVRNALLRAKKGAVLGGNELYGVASSLATLRQMKSFLSPQREAYPHLYGYYETLPEAKRLEESLFDSLETDGTLRDGASPALSMLRSRKRSAAARITERIQAYTTGKTRELLSDPIFTVRDGRYVIPLKAENRGKIRGIVHDMSGSGQTIFLEPEDVLQLGNALREVEAAERTEEVRILTVLSSKVGLVADEVTGGLDAAGALDLLFAKARLAFDMRATAPQRLNGWARIEIQGGRHPLLDDAIVVPLDIAMGRRASVLITGPNTGGKTVAIKCVGLFVAMAQSGLFLPAMDVRFAPFRQIWADIGDEQSLEQSLSTFSGHINNIAEALRGMREGALVLMDEIGAGTDPAEGAALAISILREMVKRGAAILASTHYGELKAFAFETDGFENAAMEFDHKTLRPTYRLSLGAAGASQALRIAERYGIPKDTVEEARLSLGSQARDIAAMLERLETSQKQARVAQSEADRRAEELKKAEARASRKLKEADEIRSSAHEKAHEIIEAALREIRLEASRLFDELKKTPHETKVQDRVRAGLRELDNVGRDFANEFVPKAGRAGSVAPVGLAKGMSVTVQGYAQIGTLVEDPRDGKAIVQLGSLKMTLPTSVLTIAEKAADTRPRRSVQLQKAMTANTEILLINLRAEQAERDLEKFLDDAVLAGLPSVRIVHGKGEGILRKVTQDYLKSHPSVLAFRDGEPAEGGHGVTIASFK